MENLLELVEEIKAAKEKVVSFRYKLYQNIRDLLDKYNEKHPKALKVDGVNGKAIIAFHISWLDEGMEVFSDGDDLVSFLVDAVEKEELKRLECYRMVEVSADGSALVEKDLLTFVETYLKELT